MNLFFQLNLYTAVVEHWRGVLPQPIVHIHFLAYKLYIYFFLECVVYRIARDTPKRFQNDDYEFPSSLRYSLKYRITKGKTWKYNLLSKSRSYEIKWNLIKTRHRLRRFSCCCYINDFQIANGFDGETVRQPYFRICCQVSCAVSKKIAGADCCELH